MGKQLIQQRRGRGTVKFRVRRQAYRYRSNYPTSEGKGVVVKIFNSCAHTAPLALIKMGKEKFLNFVPAGLVENQSIEVGPQSSITPGNILPLASIPLGTEIYNIEIVPYGGGKMVRTSGISAKIVKKDDYGITVLLPSKKEKLFPLQSRATIGIVAGGGRTEKPIVRAGKGWHMRHARGKIYARTSPIKMNAVAHPFGSGRGKHLGKSTIPPRFAPPGRKVGLIAARRTGRKKR